MAHAFEFFDNICCVHQRAFPARRPVMQRRLERLGIGLRVHHVMALASPGDPRVGRALTHRRLIHDAAERSLRSVLVIEDETLFLDRSEAVLASAISELRGRDWKLLNLGTWRGVDHLVAEPGCDHLVHAGGRTAPFAVAYGAASFAELLAALPVNFGGMADHLGADRSLDSILATISPAFVVNPAIATTPGSRNPPTNGGSCHEPAAHLRADPILPRPRMPMDAARHVRARPLP